MPALDSEALAAVDYDGRRHILRATFRQSRRTYDYFDVPPGAYSALLLAKSKGAWFNEHIRDHYRHREVRQFGRR
jgi:hypothetical protein